MKKLLVMLICICLLATCAMAEDTPYFERHGIEIDYSPETDMWVRNYGSLLYYWRDSYMDEGASIIPWRETFVRFVVLKDENAGDKRCIEIGMAVTQKEMLELSTWKMHDTLAVFGAYDYYSGATIDIGMPGWSVFNSNNMKAASELSCNDMHITKLADGTEIAACLRWQIWMEDEHRDPQLLCLFSFELPADYDGLVLACHKPACDAAVISDMLENGVPSLDEMGDDVHGGVYMRVE